MGTIFTKLINDSFVYYYFLIYPPQTDDVGGSALLLPREWGRLTTIFIEISHQLQRNIYPKLLNNCFGFRHVPFDLSNYSNKMCALREVPENSAKAIRNYLLLSRGFRLTCVQVDKRQGRQNSCWGSNVAENMDSNASLISFWTIVTTCFVAVTSLRENGGAKNCIGSLFGYA